MILRSWLAVLLAIVCCQALAADEVDDLIRERMQKRRIPGLSLAVVKNGEVALARGYGLANVELDVSATPETVYPIYSVTKTFTATAVMMLAADGKLSLDDKVRTHLPNLPEAWDPVTVKHLLNHTSGIKSFTSVVENFKLFRLDYSHEEVLKTVTEFPLEFKPGEKFAYNNTGYFLLGMLIEKVGGRTYAEFMKERIFEPLGMKSTQVNDLAEIIQGRASGYRLEAGKLRNAEFASTAWPFSAGSIVSTVQDMARWDAALNTEKLLNRSMLEEMWTRTTLADGTPQNYGYGWIITKHHGHETVMHGGGFHGFAATFNRFPEDRVTVIVLCNLQGGNPDSIANSVAELFIAGLKETAAAPAEDKEPEITSKAKELFLTMLAGKVNPDDFAPAARDVLPERINQTAGALSALGELKSFSFLSRNHQNEMTVSRYRAEFSSDQALVLQMSVTAEGKIAGVSLQPE